MQILVSRSKVFIPEPVAGNGGFQVAGGPSLTITAGPKYHEVPDWVRNTDTFKYGLMDGSITAVEVIKVSDVGSEETKLMDVTPAPPAPAPVKPSTKVTTKIGQ